jgi:hypothetical protein
MEHAKKLMLVEPRFYRPTIGEKTLSGLDDEIRQTLNADMPDDQKIKLYRMSLRKYMSYADNVERVADAKADAKAEEKKALEEKDVLESIAIDDRHKAKRLLTYLKRSAEAKFDHNGELTYRERRLPGSNVVDLIDSVLCKTSTDRPEGWNEFVDVLKEVKVPRTLIANERLLRSAFPGGPTRSSRSPVVPPRRHRPKRSELARLADDTTSPPKRGRASRSGSRAPRWLNY